MKPIIFLSLICCLSFACKKNNSGGGGSNNQRIKSISDGSSAQIFEYDSERRITRIYYNASFSKKFTYSPAGVNIQVFGSGDVPDPDRKYDFTIVSGRITSGIEYQPNKKSIKYSYGYDDQGRLNLVYFTFNYDNNPYENHIYELTYNAQNNVVRIGFLRKGDFGNGLENSDSLSIAREYYDKKYISWRDMGFDYFGTAPFGQEHLGYGVVVPFQLGSRVYPANNAIKAQSETRYSWNPVTKKWTHTSVHNSSADESYYGYDGSGRLISLYGQTIEWE